MYGCVFFFSSRRRHTSSKRDWSSDVCSSDLHTVPLHAQEHGNERQLHLANKQHHRSEERRVGKECKHLWEQSYDKEAGSSFVQYIYAVHVRSRNYETT